MHITKKWFLTSFGAVLIVGGGIFVAASAGEPEWYNETTGEVRVDLMPARIQIGTDLFKAGLGYLDSQNFKDPSNPGPFLVWEFEDSKDAEFWYYRGFGIVPIGTKMDSLVSTETIETAVKNRDADVPTVVAESTEEAELGG